ncbi:MAG: hypothetical protein M0R38_12260 [Bacteroidia bacterium]|nr:hypothetical protein [Bacteroidia bacterium]
MKVIRNGVFETNSSSMHSLTIDNKKDKWEDKNQIFIVVPEEYGWSGPTLTEASEKINYLFALIASTSGLSWYSEEESEYAAEEFFDSPDCKRVIAAVEDYDCKIFFKLGKNGWGQVDHQSVCSLTDFLNGIDLQEFIFNKKYKIIISNDN